MWGMNWVGFSWVGVGLRRSHAALLDNELTELETDAAVVGGLGNESWGVC